MGTDGSPPGQGGLVTAGAPTGGAAVGARARALPRRSLLSIAGERLLEAAIRVSGVSAVIFVVAIFFFIFREAAPVLVSRQFHLGEFLFSTQWFPTSESHVRYGTLALTLGTLSVTGVAIALAVPIGLGAAIFISEFCGQRLKIGRAHV